MGRQVAVLAGKYSQSGTPSSSGFSFRASADGNGRAVQVFVSATGHQRQSPAVGEVHGNRSLAVQVFTIGSTSEYRFSGLGKCSGEWLGGVGFPFSYGASKAVASV